MEPVQEDTRTGQPARTLPEARTGDYLVFELAGTRYALPVESVREVLPALAVDHLPGAGDALMGVITLRGRMVPVADMRRHLGARPRSVSLRDHFLVAEVDGRPLVVPVDRVLGLETLSRDADAETNDLVEGSGRVAWVVRDAQGLVLVPSLAGCLPDRDAA